MRYITGLLLCGWLALWGQAAAGEHLILAADEWCPFNCDAADEARPGYIIEVAKQVFSAHGIRVTYVNLPWPRAKARVSEGLVHGLIAATKEDPDTRHLIFPTRPQGQMANVFWGRKASNWQVDGLKSLRQVRLGAIKDYEYGPPLDNYLVTPNVPVHLVTGNRPLERLIRMLQSDRIDVIVEDLSVFTYTAQSLDFSDYRMLGDIPGTVERAPLYIAFSPNAQGKRYAEILSEGMQALRESGELAKIMAKYGLQDWQ